MSAESPSLPGTAAEPHRAQPQLTAAAPRGPVTHLGAADDAELRERLAAAVRAIDAPDVVVGYSRHGTRAFCTGGTRPPPNGTPRDQLRYEAGSATKTFTGLLATTLAAAGAISWQDRALPLVAPAASSGPHPATLLHLLTHTSGLPRLPRDFYRTALTRWTTNPYAGYPPARVVDAFVRHRTQRRPGTRWRYSNFGIAVLGHALTAATGQSYADLLRDQVLLPLGLRDSSCAAGTPGQDATGHLRDGRSAAPPLDIGGFAAAGAVRATPHDLLTFTEHHLPPATRRTPPAVSAAAHPAAAPQPLHQALRTVLRPVLRRGLRHQHTHTLCWFQHPSPLGPLYFHSGATSGQQTFLGFRPDTGTAVVALATRRFRAGDAFQGTAYGLLRDLD